MYPLPPHQTRQQEKTSTNVECATNLRPILSENSLPPLLSFFALPVSLYLSSSSSLIVKVLFFFGISRKDRPSLISQLWAKAGMAKPSAQSDGKEIFVEARKIKKEYFFFRNLSTEKEIRQRQYKKLLGHATTTIIATLSRPPYMHLY